MVGLGTESWHRFITDIAERLINSESEIQTFESVQQYYRQWSFQFEDKHHYREAESILTHWGRVTHICVSKLIIIGSDNGLSPSRHQAIIWTNAGKLLIGPLGTNFSEILIEIYTFSFKRMHLKMPSAKWRPFCLGLNVLIIHAPAVAVAMFHVMLWSHGWINNGNLPFCKCDSQICLFLY